MILDSNEIPGGLASTDVTPEGFVSVLFPERRWLMLTLLAALRCRRTRYLLALQIL